MSVSFLPFSLAASYSHFPPPLFGLVVLLFSDGSFERLLHPFTPPFFGTFVFLLLQLTITTTTTTTILLESNRTDDIYGMESRSAYDDDGVDELARELVERRGGKRGCWRVGERLLLFID